MTQQTQCLVCGLHVLLLAAAVVSHQKVSVAALDPYCEQSARFGPVSEGR